MNQSTRRRFIAGAVCPRCGLMDKLVVELETDRRLCVSCGFSDERPPAPAARELPTRASRAPGRRADMPADIVRLVDPGDGNQ